MATVARYTRSHSYIIMMHVHTSTHVVHVHVHVHVHASTMYMYICIVFGFGCPDKLNIIELFHVATVGTHAHISCYIINIMIHVRT